MARREEELGQPQEEVEDAEVSDSEEESEGVKGKVAVKSKGKSRRKACEKPEGSDQKRQAFSKRKRGLILKSYQLYKLTDARVFVFIVNDKGSSWAYASPGFAKTLSNQHLMQMREFAHLTGNQRLSTEIMPHPHNDNDDRRIDDRPNVLRANMVGEPTGSGFGTPARMSAAAAAAVATQVGEQMAPPPPVAVQAARRGGAAAAAQLQPPLPLTAAAVVAAAGMRDMAAGPPQAPSGRGRPPSKASNHRAQLDEDASRDDEPTRDVTGPGLVGGLEPIITPSGRRMAAAVGISLASELPLEPMRGNERDTQLALGLHNGAGFTALASDRAASAAAGLPPPLKQARYWDTTLLSGDPTAPAEPPLPPPVRARRGDPALPPARRMAGPDQPAASSEQHPLHLKEHQRQQAAFSQDPHILAGAQLQAAAAAAAATLAAAAAADDEFRLALAPPAPRGGRGGLGSPPPQLSPPQPSKQHPRNEERFMNGQVVQGSDGQLYRVIQDLDDGFDDYGVQPLPEEPVVVEAAGAPALVVSLLPMQHLPLQLQRQQQLLLAGVDAGGRGRGYGGPSGR